MIIELMNKYLNLLSKYSLINVPRDIKPLYIDDAYGHVDYENRYINAIRYYDISNKGIKSIRAKRSIYVGILGSNPLINQSIYLLLSNLGIHSINLGSVIKANSINKSLRLADILLIIDSKINLKGTFIDDIHSLIGNWQVNLKIMDKSIVVNSSDDIVTSLISALYVIRPIYMIISGTPSKTYPLIHLGPQDRQDGVYPVEFKNETTYGIVSSIDRLNSFLIIIDKIGWIELFELVY